MFYLLIYLLNVCGLMLSLVDQKKQAVGYKCPTLVACKHLWKCAVEQQYFYTYFIHSDVFLLFLLPFYLLSLFIITSPIEGDRRLCFCPHPYILYTCIL